MSNEHQRARDSAITVAELLRRYRTRDLNRDLAEPPREPEVTDDPLAAQDHPPPTRLTLSVVGLALTLAAAAGIAVVTALPAATSVPADTANAHITGTTALRPDLLAENERLSPTASAPADTEGQGTCTNVSPPPAGAVAPAAQPGTETVTRFYELLATDPIRARDMLGPKLRDAETVHGFVCAWKETRSIRLEEARAEPDGSVVATATMHPASGGELRIQQRFVVAQHPRPEVRAVELMSVIHSPR